MLVTSYYYKHIIFSDCCDYSYTRTERRLEDSSQGIWK